MYKMYVYLNYIYYNIFKKNDKSCPYINLSFRHLIKAHNIIKN